MTGRVTFIGDDGRTKVLGDGVLRIELGSGLDLGAALRVRVTDGAVTISGPDALASPSAPGALYIDANGFLRVNVPTDPGELAALLQGE